eukprot:SAG11_NODE_3221_length_2602_cov_1.722333_3_plen_100_part_00
MHAHHSTHRIVQGIVLHIESRGDGDWVTWGGAATPVKAGEAAEAAAAINTPHDCGGLRGCTCTTPHIESLNASFYSNLRIESSAEYILLFLIAVHMYTY